MHDEGQSTKATHDSLDQLSYGVRLARIAAVAANAMASLETFEDRLVRIPSCDANPHASLRQ